MKYGRAAESETLARPEDEARFTPLAILLYFAVQLVIRLLLSRNREALAPRVECRIMAQRPLSVIRGQNRLGYPNAEWADKFPAHGLTAWLFLPTDRRMPRPVGRRN